MWVTPALAAIMAGLLWWVAPDTLWIAAPILWLWLIAPAIAWWISLPLPRELPSLSPDQHAFLHRQARTPWDFLALYLGPDDTWILPAHVPEDPVTTVAHRTY